MVKAILRLPALFTAPVMAAAVFRRMERTLPRWLFYATGTGIESLCRTPRLV